MTAVSLENIREEITHTLRNSDILSVSVRGVTTTTDNFTATTGQTVFTLTHTAVKNIRSLTVASVAKRFLRDYTVNFNTGVVTLLVGAGNLDAVSIQYDYGNTDKIYPDYPRDNLSLQSFPRVAIAFTSDSTQPFQLGGLKWISDKIMTIFAWVPVNKDSAVASGLGGTDSLSNLVSSIRTAMQTNAKLFYTFQYITPTSIGPIIVGTNGKIIQQSQDFTIKHLIES